MSVPTNPTILGLVVRRGTVRAMPVATERTIAHPNRQLVVLPCAVVHPWPVLEIRPWVLPLLSWY